MDRRFAGTLAMIGIISTAIGSLIFGEGTEEPYTILTYEFPKDPHGRGRFSTGKGTDHLPLSILLNRAAAKLEILYSNLVSVSYEIDDLGQENWGMLPLTERALHVGLIPEMISIVDFPIPQEYVPEVLQIDSGNDSYTLVVLDFSNFTLWSPETESNLPVIHGVLFDEDSNVTAYFTGSHGFLGLSYGLQSLSIRLNTNETKYAMRVKGSQQVGTIPMQEAPRMGMVEFKDLVKDDIITVDLSIDPSKLPSKQFLYIARISIDGKPEEVLTTLLSR